MKDDEACKNEGPRIRVTMKGCWDCRNRVWHSWMDMGEFMCGLDKCTVSGYQWCKDWMGDA